jgi:signal peptidase I
VTRGTASFFRDNLEAFAVAIAMALVLRHYCIEAFRIPTKSMMPSLLGDDPVRRRHGDRILVDKFVAMRRDARRYEVWVFQYPLNRNRNFIKRVAGLPGEWLRIVDGDLWASTDEGSTWAIQRKPRGAQEQLFFPYYPKPVDRPEAFADKENWERGPGWRVSEREGIFKVDARGNGATKLRFAHQVLPYPDVDLTSKPYAGDVRVRFDLAVERAGRLTLYLTEHGRKHRLVLGKDESHAVIVRRENREHRFPVDVRLEDGETVCVSFSNVDDALVIEIDGDTVEIPFPDPGTEPDEPRLYGDGVEWKHEIALEAQGLAATLTDLRIDRDVYYNADTPDPRKIWKIPEDHFFMLGDNTQSSKDSRRWEVNQAQYQNGDVVIWEAPGDSDVPGQPYAARPDGDEDPILRVAADVDGLVRYVDSREVKRFRRGVSHPFVSRDHMIGRAFAIFWPIHLGPLYKGPSRVNLIR